MGFWPVVLHIIKNSDVVLLVADARVPELTLNKEVIRKAENLGKKIIFVFNKIDLVKNSMLKEQYKNSFFTSEKNKKSVLPLKKFLENLAENHPRQSLRVGIVGYPNVGKSSLINMLVPGAKVKVSSISGTTKKPEWLRSGRLRIIDSPGVIPSTDRTETIGIASAKDPHKLKNPEKTAIHLINYLNKKEKNILEKFYGISGKNSYENFIEIGRKKGFLLKGGEVDENRTAIKIIDDWQKGKIKLN